MSQIPAQLVSKSAMGTNPSIDPQYPITKSATNVNNPVEGTAVSVTTLTDHTVLRPDSPNS